MIANHILCGLCFLYIYLGAGESAIHKLVLMFHFFVLYLNNNIAEEEPCV